LSILGRLFAVVIVFGQSGRGGYIQRLGFLNSFDGFVAVIIVII
jgi:hypothetical protein